MYSNFHCRCSTRQQKRVNFVNFSDDGYIVRKHVGLVEMVPRNQKRISLNVLNDYEDADTNF